MWCRLIQVVLKPASHLVFPFGNRIGTGSSPIFTIHTIHPYYLLKPLVSSPSPSLSLSLKTLSLCHHFLSLSLSFLDLHQQPPARNPRAPDPVPQRHLCMLPAWNYWSPHANYLSARVGTRCRDSSWCVSVCAKASWRLRGIKRVRRVSLLVECVTLGFEGFLGSSRFPPLWANLSSANSDEWIIIRRNNKSSCLEYQGPSQLYSLLKILVVCQGNARHFNAIQGVSIIVEGALFSILVSSAAV